MNSTIRNSASFLALVILLVVSFYLISDATSNSSTFGKYYNWLIFFNVIGLISLLALIIYNVYKLIVQYRLKTIGSRLTARLDHKLHKSQALVKNEAGTAVSGRQFSYPASILSAKEFQPQTLVVPRNPVRWRC